MAKFTYCGNCKHLFKEIFCSVYNCFLKYDKQYKPYKCYKCNCGVNRYELAVTPYNAKRREAFKRALQSCVESGLYDCDIIAVDRKTDSWFIVTDIKKNPSGNQVESIRGFDPSDCDKDGFTWYDGNEVGYAGDSRYFVYDRKSRKRIF